MYNAIIIKVVSTLDEEITFKNMYAFVDSVGVGSGNEWLVPSWWTRHLYQ